MFAPSVVNQIVRIDMKLFHLIMLAVYIGVLLVLQNMFIGG